MKKPIRAPAPLSPILLAGLAARPLPLAPLQPALDLAVKAVSRRYPEVFDRLAEVGSPVFLIDPSDLPFGFLLRPDPLNPVLRAVRNTGRVEASATIRGPLLSLMDLLAGRRDGDSLFFSRELVIEGETEAVVALRNAVDDAEIDLMAEVFSRLGPLAGPARYLIGRAAALYDRASEDLETLRAALIAPAIRRSDALAAELSDLDRRMAAALRPARRARAERT